MSIYRPVSSVANLGMTIGTSFFSGLAGRLQSKVGTMLPSNTLGRAVGGLANAGIGTALSEANRRINSKVQRHAYSADRKIADLKNNILNKAGLGIFEQRGISTDAMHFAGGLSMKDMYDIWMESDIDNLSNKSFYVLEVNDRSGFAPTDRQGQKHSKFNLFATSLQFNSYEIQSEPVEIGSAVLDKVTNSSRTEMQLTLMDDRWGTMKQWLENKSQSIAQSNGLVLPPVYYIFDVRIVFGTNIDNGEHYKQTYQMRVGSMQHDLSRQDAALEEIQATFVQWDTFMPSFGG